MIANEIVGPCTELQKEWQVRNDKIKKWYEVLLLKDVLAEKDMESVVSNDPRTFYNLALHLLTPDVIPIKLPEHQAGREVLSQLESIQTFLEAQWFRLNKQSRRRGRQSWLRNLASYVLSTGWYSVLAYVDPEGGECVADAWNPVEVYPEFGDEELLRVAHIYRLPPRAAQRKLKQRGWKYAGNITIPMTLYDYWYLNNNGEVENAIVLGNTIVKPPTVAPFESIPVLMSPVGGLPDRGVILEGDEWKEHVGESILATNERVYLDFNKQMTFLQQLLRDTAQSRWLELSTGGDILDEDSIFKRGAIFRGSPGDQVGTIPVSPVPVEIQTQLFNLRNMIQRGGLPDALFGNVQQQIASYLMSQITSAAQQVLGPYKDAIKACLEDIDNNWISHIRDLGISTNGRTLPANMPEDLEVEVDYEISIPGDLIQRASVARMINPRFRLSDHTVTSLLFPEIRNPLEEQAKVNADDALKHPVAVTVSLIMSWRDEAARLRAEGDSASASLLEKGADQAEQMLTSPQQGQLVPTPERGTVTPPGEVTPREMLEGSI